MIKLFNLDLHISVIADIKHIINEIYGDKFEITNWSLSGHNWVFNKKTDTVDIINQHTWKNMNETAVFQFVERYRDFLSTFDGFIVTHTPVFCLLYETFQKPIILINSCRYEQPFSWNNNIDGWNNLNVKLKKMYDKKQLIAVSNNKADCEYLKLGTGIQSIIIPSMCLYTNSTYLPTCTKFVVSAPILLSENEDIINKQNYIKPRYKWSDLYSCKGIIHLPYEISTMSIFEQYSANIPLFFPSKRLLIELIHNNYCFDPRYTKSGIYTKNLDIPLNNKTWIEFWIDRADYYDDENMKYITYFDSIHELYQIVKTVDTVRISENMKEHNSKRKIQAYTQWKTIIDTIFSDAILEARVFLTFGGPTDNYRKRSKKLAEQSKEFNYFTESIGLTDDDLKNDAEFWGKHGAFLENNMRGYGFWLWKPYIIKRQFDKMAEGDILVYADCGCTLNPQGYSRFLEYIEMLESNPEKMGIISFQMDIPEFKYSKQLLLDTLCISKEMRLSGQCVGGIQIIKKNAHSKKVIHEWWNLASQHILINDDRRPHEHPKFKDHRHDQSIYSLVVKKFGSIKIPDETYFYPDWSKGLNYPIWATRIRS